MGWPAKEYERASIDYMDQQGHTVDSASPTGGYPTTSIATTEYNETNAVVRTLSADNRLTALKEAKPAEAAEKLASESKYENGRLVETLGPEHKVKLAVGKEGKHNEEVMAREHVKYSTTKARRKARRTISPQRRLTLRRLPTKKNSMRA